MAALLVLGACRCVELRPADGASCGHRL